MAVRPKAKQTCILLSGALFFLTLQNCTKITPPSRPPGYPKPYRVMGKWYQPRADSKDFRQRGIASWYGKKFHGRKTSNGENYDMYAMTAAHKTLPLGTYVKVQNLANSREVVVRVNDRGPFVRGRIIDLSYTAARKLGVIGPGTSPVEIIALGKRRGSARTATAAEAYQPTDYYTGKFTIQVGAFTSRKNAEKLVKKLGRKYKYAHMEAYDNGLNIFYRVRVGLATTLDKAQEYEQLLIQDGYTGAMIIAE